MEERIKLFIGTPCYKWPPHPMFQKSISALMADPRFDCEFRAVIGDALVERARTSMLAEYLEYKKPWEWFLQIDWDIEFRPDDVYRMCTRGEKYKVIGGPYTFKTDTEGKKANIVFRVYPNSVPNSDHLIRASYLGGGFTLTHDSVIRDLLEKCDDVRVRENPDMHDPPRISYDLWQSILLERPDWGTTDKGVHRELLSEDYAYCERILRTGYEIYMDLTVALGHWNGEECYRLPMQQQQQEPIMPEIQTIQKL